MDIEQIDTRALSLFNQLPGKYKYVITANNKLPQPTTVYGSKWTIQANISQATLHRPEYQTELTELYTLLGTPREGEPGGSALAYTEALGSFVDAHTDMFPRGPIRVMILLSNNEVSIQQDGIRTTYSKGSILVLNTTGLHDAIIESGEQMQRWLLMEAYDGHGKDTADYWKTHCEYLPNYFN